MKEISAHHRLLANHLVLTLNVDVKICRHVVDHQTVPELRAKHEMALILEVRVLHLPIVINRVCAHEFLNLIFQKMSQVKS
jgi:hypothetical protein